MSTEPAAPLTPAAERREWTPVKIVGLVMAFVVAIVAGAYGALRVMRPDQVASLSSLPMAIPRLFIPSPEQVFHRSRIKVLVLGIDYNYDDKDQEYSKDARSDTIMAVSLDFPSKSVHILSVPRDMDTIMPNGHEEKINAAYSEGGVREAKQVIARFLGLSGFDRYVVVRINAMKDLINAIGGIDVPVTETMNYDDNWGHLHIHFKPGLMHMDGEQAVSYSRFRHDALGDVGRIKRQQQVVRITIAKLKNEKFNDVAHIRELIDVLNRDVSTDITNQEKMSLANHFADLNLANVKSEQVPYVADKDLPYAGNVLIPDDAAKVALVDKLFRAPVLSVKADAPVDAKALAGIRAADVKIDVKNGSGVPGAGAKLASALTRRGFVVDGVSNAKSFDHAMTEIHVHSKTPYVGQKVQSALKLKSAQIISEADRAASPASDVTIIVGRDVAIPSVTGSEASAVK